MPHDTNEGRMCPKCYSLFERSTHLIMNAHQNEIRNIKLKFDDMVKKINEKFSQNTEEKNTIIDIILDDYMELFPEDNSSIEKKQDESLEVLTIQEEVEEVIPVFYSTYDEGNSEENNLKEKPENCCSFVNNMGLSPIPELGDTNEATLENVTFGRNKLIEVPVIDIGKLNSEMPEMSMKKKGKRVRKLNRSKSHFEFGKMAEEEGEKDGGEREKAQCSSMDKKKKKRKERGRVLRIKKHGNKKKRKPLEPKETIGAKDRKNEGKKLRENKRKPVYIPQKKPQNMKIRAKKPESLQGKENTNILRPKKEKKKAPNVIQGKRRKANQKHISKLESVYRTKKTFLNADRFERKLNSRGEKKSVTKNLFKDCYSNNNEQDDITVSILSNKRSMKSISDINVTLKNNLIIEQSLETEDIEFVESGKNVSIVLNN